MHNKVLEVLKPLALQNVGKYDFAVFPVNGYIVIKVFEKCFEKYNFEVHSLEEVDKIVEEIKAGL
ncbi:hypothetical protein V7D15_07435 [Thermoanaerobacter thermohydrosulfuricus]